MSAERRGVAALLDGRVDRLGQPEQRAAAGARTPAFDRWANHLAALLVGGIGVVLAVMKYLLEPPPDAFTVVNHPWQPAALHLHVLASPLLLLALGLLLRPHVASRLARRGFRRSRRSGLGLAAVLAPLVASGYLLQPASGEGSRRALVAIHLAGGLGWIALHVAHAVVARRRRPAGP